ncbi:hypothetical protein [Paludisphaera mucosa]|uniref:Uncharacterized protein n=1 Tax=Paludisphaera mucosa TaxID=3030827 RepID=A0ABT6FGU8_9BACT|nr:hypothetical protein [Paludisphaera mucosa]MDG3006701.1 hypothetical protein [Paludisphaera mucosa]
MRRLPFDPSRTPDRRVAPALLAAALVGLCIPVDAAAQTAPAAKSAAVEPASPATSTPGAAYVARDNLGMYLEFDGLDAHEDAWRKTAAYRMLNDTPMGAMLQEVGVPLFERVAGWLPNRKINGADGVAIIKHLARKGFVVAAHADPSAPTGRRGVIVLKGAVTSKESQALFSRLVGSFMDPAAKPRPERKGGRVIVVVPSAKGDPKTPDQGWAWWPEKKEDLVIGFGQPSDADAVAATLDGKSPNVVGYEPVTALAKIEAGLVPVLRAFVDPNVRPGKLDQPMVDLGVKKVEYVWGFQDDALASVTRIVAPKPRQGALAFLDQPVFEAKKLLPIPDGVEYFASASLKPEQWSAMIKSVALGAGEVAKGRYEEIAENVRTRSRMDFEKDFLGNLGPRVVVYLSPNTSAATVEEAPAGSLTDPTALLSMMGPRTPKPVLVAEVGDPARFSRALDAVMLEVNRKIKEAAAEQVAAAVKAEAARPGPGGPGGPGFPGGRGEGEGAGGERKDRRRDEAAIPEFRLLPSQAGENSRTYTLYVPTSSQAKFVTPGFKPTVRLEAGFLAVSTSPEAARLAVESLRRKTWTAPEAIAQALAKAPESAVLLMYGDFRETTAAVLASLPGTLQTGINTAIAASEVILNPPAVANAPGQGAAGLPGISSALSSSGGSSSSGMIAPGGSSNSGMSSSRGSSSGMRGPGGMMSPGVGSSSMGPQGPQGGGPGAAAPGPGDASMISIRVDPAHLPKADELKALMFPSTTTVAVDDDSIRIVTRGAFPDMTALLGTKGVLPAMLAPAIASARVAARAAAANAAATAAPAQPGQPGQPGAGPGQPGAGAMPPKGGAGRRGPDR